MIFGEQENSKDGDDDGMGQFGKLTSISQLPKDKVLLGYVKTAMRLNEEGVKVPRPNSKARKELTVPDYLLAALKKNKAAGATFANFSYGHKKEYVEWLTEAKREETRDKRVAQMLLNLRTGKKKS